jgi:hypothetical protein
VLEAGVCRAFVLTPVPMRVLLQGLAGKDSVGAIFNRRAVLQRRQETLVCSIVTNLFHKAEHGIISLYL